MQTDNQTNKRKNKLPFARGSMLKSSKVRQTNKQNTEIYASINFNSNKLKQEEKNTHHSLPFISLKLFVYIYNSQYINLLTQMSTVERKKKRQAQS